MKLSKIKAASKDLKDYINGKIPLKEKEVNEAINILIQEEHELMNFIQVFRGRLKNSRLTDKQKDKIFRNCTNNSEISFWLVNLFPDTKYREEAVKSILKSPEWSASFRLERLYNSEEEMHKASKKALSTNLNLYKFLNQISNLDEYEKDIIVKNIMRSEHINLANNINMNIYPELNLSDRHKQILESLIIAYKLKGDNK